MSPEIKEKALNVIFGLLLTLTLVVLAGIPALEQVKVVSSIAHEQTNYNQNPEAKYLEH